MSITTFILCDVIKGGLPLAPSDSEITARIGPRQREIFDFSEEEAMSEDFAQSSLGLLTGMLGLSESTCQVTALHPGESKANREYICLTEDFRGYGCAEDGKKLVMWQPENGRVGVFIGGIRTGDDNDDTYANFEIAITACRQGGTYQKWSIHSRFEVQSDLRLWKKIRSLYTVNMTFYLKKLLTSKGMPSTEISELERKILKEETVASAWSKLISSVNLRPNNRRLRQKVNRLSLPLTDRKLETFARAIGLTEGQRAYLNRNWREQFESKNQPPPRFTLKHVPPAVIMTEFADGPEAVAGNFQQRIDFYDAKEVEAAMLVNQLKGSTDAVTDQLELDQSLLMEVLEREISQAVDRLESINQSVWEAVLKLTG